MQFPLHLTILTLFVTLKLAAKNREKSEDSYSEWQMVEVR